MEQAVAERPLSQDQGLSQLHLHHNGTLNSSGARCENDPSGRWYPRRWTGLRGTLSSGPFAGDRSRQDRSSVAVCRDNLRGSCARGASCKYQHSESDRHDGSKFYRNEPENLVAVANSGNSQYRASVNNDSRTRFSSRGGRSRSPCRRFQNGRCFNGTSCPYLHSALTRTYDSSLEQQRVDRAVRDPGFGEGNRDNTIRMSQHCDEANKENSLKSTSFSVERRSRSPCRNYQRGRCIYGASCKRLHIDNALGRSRYDLSNQRHQGVVATSSNSGSGQGSRDVTLRTPQVHEEVNMHNNLRTGAFSREPRNRSPCPNFLSGKCYRGASCVRWHPVTVYDRTRYDSWSAQQHQHQHQGVSAISRAPNIDDSCRGMHVVNEQKKAWSTRDDVQFAGDREGADVESRSWSSERQRSRSAIDFGGDKLIREVCLKFTKGRCNRGELCRYLHGYHAYASSNWNKPTAEAAGDIRNNRGTNQHANTMMAQEHDDVKNYKTSLGNSKHSESSIVSSDGCLDKVTIGRSVRDTVELKIHDQKGHASAMDGRRCDIPGENIVNNHCSAKGQEDISLWSRPFKRRRSRSPYAPRDEFHCRNRMKFDSRVDLHRDRCYNVARFQYPDRRSYKYERPINHANSLQHSRGGSASVNPSYEGKNYKSVAPEGHDEVTSQGLQLDQGPRGSLGSNVAVASKKNEAASARCVLQPSHTERNGEELANDSIAVGSSERAAANGQKVLESDLTHSCGEDHISPTNIDLTISEKEGNAVMTMEICLESNKKPPELMPTIKTYSRKKSKKKLRSVSSEETIKEGVNNDSEQMPTSSLVETSSSKPKSGIPADIETSASENKYKKENKKRKKKISESVSCETMKEEAIDAPKQGMSSSSLEETSLHNPAKKRKKKCKNKNPEYVSCNENMNEEAANASKKEMPTSSLAAVSLSASKDNDSENMLMDVCPVKPQGNGCMTNLTVGNVESVLVTKELLVDNAHSHSVQSLPKSLAPNASKKLLVLDVNGLLADIVACYSRQFKPDTTVSAKGVFKRPFCDDFLKFCFLKFNVGIWSSRTRKNVNAVVDYLMKSTKQHLLFCWDQSHCTTTGYKTLENTEKPLVLKELKYLWDSEEENCPWEKRFYNETNTVLLDDSPYKALRNPPNTAIFPYPYTYENVEDKSLGPGGDLRVYLERLAEAENVQKFIQENPFGQEPITKSHKSWSFYSKIVGTYVGEHEENAYITPDS